MASSRARLLSLACTTGLVWSCSAEAPVPTFSLAAGEVEGGVLLSAFSRGDDVVFVGGELSSAPGNEPGGPAIMVTYDGADLCVRKGIAPRTLWWIDGSSSGEMFMVGEQGTILRMSGEETVDESVETSATLYGVWAGPPHPVAVGGDVWGTGTGEIWQRDESDTWTKTHDLPGVAFKVWRSFVVGDGFAGRLQGSDFMLTPLPVEAALLTVRGRDDEDVWAAGGRNSPVLMHWDGTSWTAVPVDTSCAPSGLNGVYTAANEDVWVAGNFGAAARFDGQHWYCERPSPAPEEHFHMVWGHGDEILFSGGDLFMPGNNHGTIIRWSPDDAPVPVRPCP